MPGAGSAGTPLGPAAEVPVGGGKIYEALEVVVTQLAPGDFRGFSAVCTHNGTVAAGPAPRALPSRPVAIVDGQVVLT